MEELRQAQYNKLEQLKDLKKLQGEEFRKQLIEWTQSSDCLESEFEKVTINGIQLNKHEQFISKKNDALVFCNELLNKTNGKVQINRCDSLFIPHKLLLAGNKINKFSQKQSLIAEEVNDLINTYKMLFEAVKKIIEPHFKSILNKNGFLDWSDISKAIKNLEGNFQKLFSSMNGVLRDAVVHESTYTEKDTFIWALEDGTEVEYPLKKVFEKVYDLVFLIIVLYWALSKIQLKYFVDYYKIAPIDKLKSIVDNIRTD